MSVSKAAKLILTLVDQVSGPARAITSAMTGVNNAITGAGAVAMAPANALANAARGIRRGASDLTVASGAISIGLGKAGKDIYDFNDTLNEIVGRRFGKDALMTLADGTTMTKKAFRKSVSDLVTTIDRESPRTAGEIVKAYNQLVQAGLSHEQIEAILPISVKFAIAGNYDTEEAADKLTNVMTSMQMPQATFEDAQQSAQRAADVIAYAANKTNSDVRQMTEAFKYAAPSAAALGISIEQLAAMFVVQAKRGIKASEAGVSIRAMFTRMVRPTKMAAAALSQYNIDLADYLERNKEITSGDVTNALKAGGVDASGAAAEIDAILRSDQKTADKVQKITAAITKSVGDQSTLSADTISEAVREVLYSFGESLDVERLIEDMQKADIAVSDFFKIFDVRQGARTLSLFSDDLGKWVRDIEANAIGFSDALSKERMEGIVGAVQRLNSSLFRLFLTIAEAGVLDTATNGFEGLAAAVTKMAEANPAMLETGTYALIAAAALAPLGFALTGLAGAASLLVNPIAWAAAGLAYLAYQNFDDVVAGLKQLKTAFDEFRQTKFATEFMKGAGEALQGLADAGRSAVQTLKDLGVEYRAIMEFFNSDEGAGWGKTLGQVAVYGGALFFAAAGLGLVAGTLKKVGNAMLILSGIKPAFALVRWLFNLRSAGRGIAATAAGLERVNTAARTAGRIARPSLWGALFGAGLGLDLVNNIPDTKEGVEDMYRKNKARSEGWNKWLEENVGSPSSWWGSGDSSAPNAGGRQQDALRSQMDAMTADWPARAKRALASYGNALVQGGAEAEAQAAQIGQRIEQELSVTGHPDVNTAKLERALGLARQLAAAIRGVGSGGGDPAASNGAKFGGPRARGGPVRRGLTYLVGENQPELFTPNTNGRIIPEVPSGGGGIAVHINMPLQVSGGASAEIERLATQAAERVVAKVTGALDRTLNRSPQVTFGGLKPYGDA